MKEVKISEMQYLNIKNFGINVKKEDIEKFIDDVENLCERYAINDEYYFKFD